MTYIELQKLFLKILIYDKISTLSLNFILLLQMFTWISYFQNKQVVYNHNYKLFRLIFNVQGFTFLIEMSF